MINYLFLKPDGVSWFPPQWIHIFYLVKGSLGLIALLLVVWHMSHTWDKVTTYGTKGQVLRYICSAALHRDSGSGSTVEQIHLRNEIHYINLANFVAILVTIVAMLVSIT
jgi:hypothetical protein